MKGNYIAKNMNLVNRNSVHKSLKDSLMEDESYWINEGIDQYKAEKKENAEFAKQLRTTDL